MSALPSQSRYIIGTEACERFSFYGMKSILMLYMTGHLLMSDNWATSTLHIFVGMVYLLPLAGAWLADKVWGRYKTILYISLLYCVGHGVLATADLFHTIEARRYILMAGLFINVNYIVVPIFLMLRDSDVWLKGHFGSGFLLNNLVVLAVVYAATALPFTIYLLSGYFATLPHDFEEAAYIDGASYFSTMTRIIFPMAKPSIITIILFNFLSFWNEYIISMTLMSSTKAPRTLPVGLLNLMQAQQSAAQYGTMYAGLVLVMLPTLILYICVQRQLTQGMTVGGLKG